MATRAELNAKLAQEKQVLADLTEEHISLRGEEKQVRDRLEQITARQRALCGGYRGGGEISQAKANIEQLRRELHDLDARVVIWESQPDRWSRTGNERVEIVSRVTKKRIYVRTRGSSHETYYDKETGKRDRWSGTINIKATFPEGVESWKS